MPPADPEPYLIAAVHLADLSRKQITGAACVYCAGEKQLAYAGWLRSPLCPGRYLSAPVSACSRCRSAHDPTPSEASP